MKGSLFRAAALALFLCSGFGVWAERPKVALVLEGGSAWGLAHIGVIKVIEELGIPVDIVVGTSMGSIIGGMYAMGYSAADMAAIAGSADWMDLFMEDGATGSDSFTGRADRAAYAASIDFDRSGFRTSGGIISGRKIVRFMDTLALGIPTPVDFDALPRRFRAVATDISTGERVVLSRGSIPDAMRASMSIPGIFTPWYLDGRYLADGFAVDNLPISLAREMGADIVIAVDLFDASGYDPDKQGLTPVAPLSRILDLMTRDTVERQLPLADLIIALDMCDFDKGWFDRAGVFAAYGEAGARLKETELRAIAARTAAEPLHSAPAYSNSPVRTVTVLGGTESDRRETEALFSAVLGKAPDQALLDPLFGKLDRTGKFECVRVRRDSAGDGDSLVVELTKKTRDSHTARVSFLYETTFSTLATSNVDVVPSIEYRGLTTDNSLLLVDAELVDAPGIDIRFSQPVGNRVRVIPFWAWRNESTTRLTGTALGYLYQTVSWSGGLDIAFEPATGVEFGLGWSYDRIHTEDFPEISSTGSVECASLVHGHLAIRELDSPILPMNGISANFGMLVSLTSLGSERSFMTLTTDGSTFLSLGTPFSVAFLWTGGTDFSAGNGNTAPPFYKPDLSNRRLFPGPLSMDEIMGSHVAGIGLEVKHHLNWKDKGIPFPAFIILAGAAGTVVQDPLRIDPETDVIHWNATAGAGIRVNDAFGIILRGGVQRTSLRAFVPFVSLDLGAIGKKN